MSFHLSSQRQPVSELDVETATSKSGQPGMEHIFISMKNSRNSIIVTLTAIGNNLTVCGGLSDREWSSDR